MPATQVLVVAYGDPALLDACLSAGQGHFATVVVDNGLSDAARSVTQSHGAKYVRPTGNLGFAAGVNLGLEHIAGDAHVLLVNPDARLGPAAAEELTRSLCD